MMLPVFNQWPQIISRLGSAPRIALFLDFDGTLARLQPRPEQVSLDDSVRRDLTAMARSPRFRIWVISGRRQSDIRARVQIPGITYLGLHGWEGSGGLVTEETRQSLRLALCRLQASLAELPGLWIEDKEYAFAVHYREAAARDVVRARTILEGIVLPRGNTFRIEQGKNVWEVLPRELGDKGAAVRQQLALLRGRYSLVYMGDDQVDEPAFAALRAGITVRVGRPVPSRARYRLGGVADVRRFLHQLRTEFL
ncbi:MAG TPA: trehalose-phosphatase [Bryobacteraceae bacterium]|nr:trehalose-phosphatase [Bryobacteraceae bacterium]